MPFSSTDWSNPSPFSHSTIHPAQVLYLRIIKVSNQLFTDAQRPNNLSQIIITVMMTYRSKPSIQPIVSHLPSNLQLFRFTFAGLWIQSFPTIIQMGRNGHVNFSLSHRSQSDRISSIYPLGTFRAGTRMCTPMQKHVPLWIYSHKTRKDSWLLTGEPTPLSAVQM